MPDLQTDLVNFTPNKDYLICIDSDGCVFDTVEIKQKECFIPNIIKHWQLQPISKYARAAAEFINIYSKWRGINRFPALTMTFDLLHDWPEVQKREVEIPQVDSLRAWIERETKLGSPTLKAEVDKTGDPVLKTALQWSDGINESVRDMVYGIPPFPFVRESLEKISQYADAIVCSTTSTAALNREWAEHNVKRYTRLICGQEMGTKKVHINMASKDNYPPGHVLMMGDAVGDLEAAKANHALFFPIVAGEEDSCWQLFLNEAADKFFNGSYSQRYEAELITRFRNKLSDVPPWKK